MVEDRREQKMMVEGWQEQKMMMEGRMELKMEVKALIAMEEGRHLWASNLR